ncbi:MAG: hypothetical protein RI924_75 [Bacteroidota bacterium]|jgi:dTDP-4-dehydrorhamnose reductase
MKKSNLEIWGGLECTINRVGDQYYVQLAYAGHWDRSGDLNRIAQLGISKIRYPILWERHQDKQHEYRHWETTERKLQELKAHQLDPIAGLIHHGSGPAFTNLLDPDFAEKFADYAYQVAKRFPWINHYIPVNEPLTTARFSGLYGLWYPHSRDDLSFVRMLVHQCKASILAMQAIRSVNPQAIWIQTEDLGKTHSTETLRYQADFENKRRWLGFDLLMGKVNSQHPLWDYLKWTGLDLKELDFFQAQSMRPAIIGFNYYLTSERFLDERLNLYPKHTHGTNHLHAYADLEAIRACPHQFSGIKTLLMEAWEHLQQDMAITELHLHCSREEQLRWFLENWNAVRELETRGIPIKAITAWALLGSFGWNQLLTAGKGMYESGVFDISSGYPRPTALAKLLRQITEQKSTPHPVFSRSGWWHRHQTSTQKSSYAQNNHSPESFKPLLIIGKNGTLGQAFARICSQRALDFRVSSREELDITNRFSIEKMIETYQPWAIVNTAGYVHVDHAEQDPAACFMANTQGAENLAKACARHKIKLLTFSSDLVFGGNKRRAYLESDPVSPLNIYGQSKALAERRMLKAYPKALIVRSSSFFGPWDEANFAYQVVQSLRKDERVLAAKDVFISPTYVPELTERCLDLLLDEESGIWHLVNQGMLSWADFAEDIAVKAGYPRSAITRKRAQELGFKAIRPAFSVLQSERGANLGSLEQALSQFFEHLSIRHLIQ